MIIECNSNRPASVSVDGTKSGIDDRQPAQRERKYLRQLSGHLELSALANISVADVLLSAGATGEPFSKAITETLYPTSSRISMCTHHAREEKQTWASSVPGAMEGNPWNTCQNNTVKKSGSYRE